MNDTKKSERNCANCACHALQANPMIPGAAPTSVCMLNMPMLLQGEGLQPMLDRQGNAIVQKNKETGIPEPRMEKIVKQFFTYPPTQPELVCYDGWRPLGTEPGTRGNLRDDIGVIMQAMQPLMDVLGITLAKPSLDG
jgi:hypothetical protein